MGAKGRVETPDLIRLDPADRLMEDPTAFGFFQAVRLLERTHPDRSPVGGLADPSEEVARFSVNPALGFPASEIQGISEPEDGPTRLLVNFFGLTGPQGVLPLAYSQLVAERQRAKDPAMRDFLDIFHHRMISLFYRAWEKYRFAVGYERNQKDKLTEHIADLMGLGPDRQVDEPVIKREALLYYSGLVASRQRSAQAMEAMLEDYFGVDVKVEQFVGAWYPLSQDGLCILDDDPAPGAAGLGEGCPAGDEIWDQQARVRLRLGPLRRKQYESFLPRGTAHKALKELTRQFGGEGFDMEVQLVLDRRDVPGTMLGAERNGLPLGWGSMLTTRPLDRDPDDTILTL